MNRSGPLRVCHVITLLELGGAQDNTLYTVSHLGPRFRPLLVCGPGGLLDEEARALGVPLRFVPALRRAIRPVADLRALVALTRLFRRERPDIVHTHSSKAGILGRLAARLAGVPRVVHTIHGFGFNDTQPRAVRKALLAAERLASAGTDRFVAVSRANLEQGVRLRLFDRGRVTLIRSGVRLAAFGEHAARRHESRTGLRRELGVPENAPIVGMVACLKPQKDPLTFVEVAARVVADAPSAIFVLAGDGVLRGAVEKRLRRLGIGSRVRLLGWRRDLPAFMSGIDVLLHTSLWEGLPRVFPEAIAAGAPIVATAVDGATDILEDDVSALLRRAGDVEGLAAAVTRLLREPETRARLSGRARSVLPEFDIDAMVRAQEDLYLSLFEAEARVPAAPREPLTTNNDVPPGAAAGASGVRKVASR